MWRMRNLCPRELWQELCVYCALASVVVALIATPRVSRARSGLILPYPPTIGTIAVDTYDNDGNRVGDATVRYTRKPDGRIHFHAAAAKTGGPRNVIEAEFEEIEPGKTVRVLWETSLSHDEQGQPMVLVELDHQNQEARCTLPGAETEILKLDAEEQVTNATMDLLFRSLVRGDVQQVQFQVFLCRGGARFVDFVASRAPTQNDSAGVIEVRFGPNLGRMMSWITSFALPKLRFWFDTTSDDRYLAHRMPLYGGGPEVLVVRDGISPLCCRPR